MEIPALFCLKHLSIFIGCYLIMYYFYKKILNPEYRWRQRDNICYDECRYFAQIFGSITFIITELIINKGIIFTLN